MRPIVLGIFAAMILVAPACAQEGGPVEPDTAGDEDFRQAVNADPTDTELFDVGDVPPRASEGCLP